MIQRQGIHDGADLNTKVKNNNQLRWEKERAEEKLTTTTGKTNFQNKTGNSRKLTIQILVLGALNLTRSQKS